MAYRLTEARVATEALGANPDDTAQAIRADWETLLEQPLEELRERLGVGPAPLYEQDRSPGAPILAN